MKQGRVMGLLREYHAFYLMMDGPINAKEGGVYLCRYASSHNDLIVIIGMLACQAPEL